MSNSRGIKAVLLGLLLACGTSSIAQERGSWRATSSTAKAITGDVIFSGERVTINFAAFIIAQIRTVQPAEAAATFNLEPGETGSGNIYRLNVPAATKFQHKNTLCGSEETDYMVTYVAGKTLHVAFFSGMKLPVLTPEALANTPDLCGTFLYTR
jgi:hypothetical protein